MSYTTNANTEGVSVEYKENDMEVEKVKLGIKETQEFMSAMKAFVAEAKQAMADKHISFAEYLGIVPETLKVITEGKDYKLILDEIKDIDGEEAKEILCDLVDTIFASNE